MSRPARFWVWVNGGWVRLSLLPGECLSWRSFRYTDEGWSEVFNTWHHHFRAVRWEWSESALDCDGRIDRGGEMVCPIGQLSDRDVYSLCDADENRGILAPEWEPVERYQRDHAAEAAGY